LAIDFERIYGTDLVYHKDCWKLCGDGHCCTFSRHKSRFKLIGTPAAQQLPLLPGEYAFLRDKGWLSQYRDHELRSFDLDFHGRRLSVESLVGHSSGCLCKHDVRTTICRLYPFLPVLDLDGRLRDLDLLFGSFEVLEELQGTGRYCRIEKVDPQEFAKFAAISREIGTDPVSAFYVAAYRTALRHVHQRLADMGRGKQDVDYFRLYEMSLIRSKLIDRATFDQQLLELALLYEERYGDAFRLGAAAR